MNTVLRQCGLAVALALAAGGAAAGVTVTYAQPDRFSDVPFTTWERDRVLKELTGHFDKLAKTLPAGQDLKIEVLDLDLAGHARHDVRSGGQELRILTGGADWPHMKLRYTLLQDGKVIRSGEDNLQDMNYLHQHNRYVGSELLRYEKKMVDDWFKQALAAR